MCRRTDFHLGYHGSFCEDVSHQESETLQLQDLLKVLDLKTLIITNKDDAHADALIDLGDGCLGAGQMIRLNTEDLFKTVSFNITERSLNLSMSDSGVSCSLNDLSGAWYRRPLDPDIPADVAPGIAKFFRDEGWEVIQGIFSCCRDVKCLPRPDFAVPPRNKIHQLHLASKMGFNVPKSLISNQFDRLLTFARDQGPCVIKGLRWPSIREEQRIVSLYARDVSWRYLKQREKDFKMPVPVFLQEKISKTIDVRVVVIGKHCFFVGMASKNNSIVDIRDVEPQDIEYSVISDPPSGMFDKIREFLSSSGLIYSSLDFVVDKDGVWWFLENNPNGQFYWLERETGLPMRRALLAELA